MASMETDEPKTAEPITKVVDGVVAARNWVFEREGDCIQLAVGDTHTPDEVLDISDVFLMGLGGKDNKGTPRAFALVNPIIVEQRVDLFHDDNGLVPSIVGLRAADRVGGASVNAEFKSQDGVVSAVFIETIPMLLNDSTNLGVNARVNVVADTHPSQELRQRVKEI